MLCLKPGWLPVIVGILLATGSILAYVISVLKGDVTPLIPFISEAGGYLPQSGIFSLFMIFTSVSSILAMFIRYLLVRDLLKSEVSQMPKIVNRTALVLGIASSLGLLIVAVYPLTTIEIAHDIGAYSTFLLGVCYAFSQTYLSYCLYPEFNGIAICRTRLVVGLGSLASVIVMVIFYVLAEIEWNDTTQIHLRARREPGDQGYLAFMIAASAEWAMAFFYILFFFTYIREFQKIYVHFAVRPLVKHFDAEASLTMTWEEERRPILVS